MEKEKKLRFMEIPEYISVYNYENDTFSIYRRIKFASHCPCCGTIVPKYDYRYVKDVSYDELRELKGQLKFVDK